MAVVGERLPSGQVQDPRSLCRQGGASPATSIGRPERCVFLEATTCTATSGLGHASSTKPWRTCERQVQDARPTTRTHSSSPRACAEQDLTLHLLDVVPESDIQKAREVHGQQDLNATQCVRAGWRAGEVVVGRLGAGARARWGGETEMERSAHHSSAGQASGGTAAGDAR